MIMYLDFTYKKLYLKIVAMYINNFIDTTMSLSQNILCNSDLKQVLCDKNELDNTHGMKLFVESEK